MDSISISRQHICLKIKNKVTLQRTFNNIESILYNGTKDTLQVKADGKSVTFSLGRFRVSYNEANTIRKKLNDFNINLHSEPQKN